MLISTKYSSNIVLTFWVICRFLQEQYRLFIIFLRSQHAGIPQTIANVLHELFMKQTVIILFRRRASLSYIQEFAWKRQNPAPSSVGSNSSTFLRHGTQVFLCDTSNIHPHSPPAYTTYCSPCEDTAPFRLHLTHTPHPHPSLAPAVVSSSPAFRQTSQRSEHLDCSG